MVVKAKIRISANGRSSYFLRDNDRPDVNIMTVWSNLEHVGLGKMIGLVSDDTNW